MPLEIGQLANRLTALGAACHFLGGRPPFAGFRAEVLIGTLHGQVERGHYLFAHQGPRVRGYIGWAMLDAAVAARVARTGVPPGPEEARGGRDVVWVLTVAATDREAMLACVNAVKARHAGLRVMGVRHRPNGAVVVFDQPVRPRRPEMAGPPPSGTALP